MKRILLLATTLVSPVPALAHHPLGGDAPASLFEGLASGLAHPVIGFDHLAFVVLVGLAAARARRPLAGVLAFVATTAVGVLIHLGGVTLPFGEAVIALSIVALGAALVMRRRVVQPAALIAGFAAAGLFHGWAYGAAVVGSEATPIVAYLAGLVLIQGAVAIGVAALTGRVTAAAPGGAPAGAVTGLHIAAAVCIGVGLTFFLESMETAILGSL